ncbi:hypothetical protein V1511DRAFT_461741, partial [Dipodascopsis uninucleata]
MSLFLDRGKQQQQKQQQKQPQQKEPEEQEQAQQPQEKSEAKQKFQEPIQKFVLEEQQSEQDKEQEAQQRQQTHHLNVSTSIDDSRETANMQSLSSGDISHSVSLPSVEPSFTGSLINEDSSDFASPTLIRQQGQKIVSGGSSSENFGLSTLSSPPISPTPSPPLPAVEDLDIDNRLLSHDEESDSTQFQIGRSSAKQYGTGYDDTEEDETADNDFDMSPLLKKSSFISHKLESSSETGIYSDSSSSAQDLKSTPRPMVDISRYHDIDPTETAVVSRVQNMEISDSAVKNFMQQKSVHEEAVSIKATGVFRESRRNDANIANNTNTTTTIPGALLPSTASSASIRPPNIAASKLTLKEQSALIDKLQKENWGYQLKIYILQEELDRRSEDSVRDMRNENIDVKSKNIGLNIEIKKLKRRIAELETQFQEIEHSHQDPEEMIDPAEVEELKGQLYELQVELANKDDDLRGKVAEVGGLRERINTLEFREKQNIEEIDRLRGAQNDDLWEEEIRALKEYLGREQQARDAAQKLNMDLRSEILRLRRSLSKAGERDVTGELQRLRSENNELRREISRNNSDIGSSDPEKERLYRELEDIKRSVMRSSSTSTTRHSLTSQALDSDDYEIAISELKDKLSEVKYIARERKIQVDILNKENGELQDMVETLQNTVQSITDERTSLQADVAQLLKEASAREEEIVTWQEDYEVLSTEADAELTRLSDLVKSKDAEFERLQAEIEAFTKLVTAFERETESMKIETQSWKKKVEEQENIINQLQTQLDNAHHNAARHTEDPALKQQITDYEDTILELRKELKNALGAVKGRDVLDQQIKEYERAMEGLEMQLQKLQKESMARADARAEWAKLASEYDSKISTL